ncbi:H+transporting two-sector ATPase E subunit [Desulfovibrio sp. X2]|uniref:FliH/SctL family protein n=1 Tax=Desulfovibrio sp. X2 TaxID=941449 RepID=UPI000358884F|nr:V-type ATP synthase subunit E family protein [Desulfovibrio sp. X2]EPR44306.1 H+transporting two-sector ATPase E subunit [Desulfovibrio sp. X2]
MSSSSDKEAGGSKGLGPITGRVFLGVDTPGPDMATIQELEGKRKLVWDQATNTELVERVKQKARSMAREILEEARAEAERIKEAARGEGFQQGLEQAREQVEQEQTALAEAVGNALSAIRGQARQVWTAQRADFVALIRMAVEKTVNAEMSERRREILENLVDQALETIDSMRGLTIRARPEEAELLTAILNHVAERFPELKSYRVKPDESLTLGGMVIESADGMVDNTLATRWAAVEKIFAHLEQSDPGQAPAFPDEPAPASNAAPGGKE